MCGWGYLVSGSPSLEMMDPTHHEVNTPTSWPTKMTRCIGWKPMQLGSTREFGKGMWYPEKFMIWPSGSDVKL